MFAFFLVTVLAATEPSSPDEIGTASFSPPDRNLVMTRMAEMPVIRPSPLLHNPLIAPIDEPLPALSNIPDFVPYSNEMEEMKDWFHQHRADRRWRNGIGVTFTLGRQRHRWTFGLGPIQFTFGGDHHPPDK